MPIDARLGENGGAVPLNRKSNLPKHWDNGLVAGVVRCRDRDAPSHWSGPQQFGLPEGQIVGTCLRSWESVMGRHDHVHGGGSSLTGSIWDQGSMVIQPGGQEGWDENL